MPTANGEGLGPMRGEDRKGVGSDAPLGLTSRLNHQAFTVGHRSLDVFGVGMDRDERKESALGRNIAGVEFDHEGDDESGPFHIPAKNWGRAGIVSKEEATWFTQLMDEMQRSMGGNYTVSEDIGVWGFGGIDDRGDERLYSYGPI